jgi:hypothetical protein
MARRKFLIQGVATTLVTMAVVGQACGRQHGFGHGGGHGGGFQHGGQGRVVGGFVPFGGFGVGIPIFFTPVVFAGPGMFFGPMPVGMLSGPLMPLPPPGMIAPPARAGANGNAMGGVRAKAADPARAAQLVIVGDRLLRAGNLKKAEERFLQAMRAAPDLAAPRVHLALVAVARGNYAEAASRLREAETAEPGWIVNSPDIQSIFGEPTDFTRQLARVESHVQTHPEDRDAWLVLGAEWFLSGRTSKAADVFRRLQDPDRRSDVALRAFLDASNQAKPRGDRDR